MINRREFLLLLPLLGSSQAVGAVTNNQISKLIKSAKKEIIYIPAGDYLISQPVFVLLERSLSIRCHPNAKFIATSSFPKNKKFFHFNARDHIRIKFEWRGGQFHGQNIPVRTSGAPNLLAVIGKGIERCLVEDVEFFRRGKSINRASSLFFAGVNSIEVSGCRFSGSDDASIYFSGDSTQRYGRRGLVSGCYFQDTTVGVIAKRNFRELIITNNNFRNAVHGVVLGGEADGNKTPGHTGIVANNIFNGVIKAIEFRHTSYGIARGNIVKGVGIHGGNRKVVPNTAISIRGSSYCQVQGNTIIPLQGQHKSCRAFQYSDLHIQNPGSYLHSISYNNIIHNNFVTGKMKNIVNWSIGSNNWYVGN